MCVYKEGVIQYWQDKVIQCLQERAIQYICKWRGLFSVFVGEVAIWWVCKRGLYGEFVPEGEGYSAYLSETVIHTLYFKYKVVSH